MRGQFIRIEVPEGEVKKILDELTEAQDKIYKCYDRLEELGVVTIKEQTTREI
jgi:hypothetical protein